MEEQIDLYLRLPYPTIVTPEETTDGGVCCLAYHPDLPGCMSHGDTVQEALGSLQEARRLYIAGLLKRKQPVPLPSTQTFGNLQFETIICEFFATPGISQEQHVPRYMIDQDGKRLIEDESRV